MVTKIKLPFKRYLSKRFVENKVKFQQAKLADAVLTKTTSHPRINLVEIGQDFDNRCQEDIQIEQIFLRTYINGVPWGFIIWQQIQKEYGMPRPEEVSTSPDNKFNFPKNSNSLIRYRISIPPFVSTEERLYIDLWGYIVLKSSLGSFTKEISVQVWVDKADWG